MTDRTYGDAVRESLAPLIAEATASELTIDVLLPTHDRSDPQSVGYELLSRAHTVRQNFHGTKVRLHEVHDAMLEGLPSGCLSAGQSMMDMA